VLASPSIEYRDRRTGTQAQHVRDVVGRLLAECKHHPVLKLR
jgi:hypothetical protein